MAVSSEKLDGGLEVVVEVVVEVPWEGRISRGFFFILQVLGGSNRRHLFLFLVYLWLGAWATLFCLVTQG